MFESKVRKLTYAVLYTGSNDEVLGLVLLKNEPHAFYVIHGISPVTQRVHITKIQTILYTLRDTSCSKGNLTSYEGLTTALALVVEQDAGAAEHFVGLTIFLDYPEAILLGNSIRAIGMERCILVLRNFFYFTIEL